VGQLGLAEADALARLRDYGVLLSPTKPGVLRAVTHMDVGDNDIEQALHAVPHALGACVSA
jgi:hypothetical protein